MRVQTLIVNTLLGAAVAATGCAGRMAYNLPPASRLMHPGPGVDGPGPGVIPVGNQMMGPAMPAQYGPGGTPPANYGACRCNYEGEQCQYCEDGSCSINGGGGCYAGGGAASGPTSQVQFVGEDGLTIAWDVASPGMFDSAPLFVPDRQDFPQGAIYRLKVSNIPGRAGVTLYPTLEVAPVTARTDAFLAHAAVPVQFTEEDFDQVMSGNFVTKVIYLPDPEFQELALSGVETLVSTRLDPGVDPVAEADRRGSILAVLRMGSKDLSTAGGSYGDQVMPAAYGAGCDNCGPSGGGASSPSFSGPMYGGGGGQANMPIGMPAAGFAPQPMPPHMLAGAPQWGMPHTGTPIGIPGPPHLPMGSPAGLQKHTIKNRTRVHLPPPTNAVHVSVKQRPGLNYPRPVNKIHVDEVNRAPIDLIHGTVKPGVGIRTAVQGAQAYPHGGGDCEEYCD
ncbi:hypothetical protein Pla108_06050 [Botrimarina colliarenosi]|uniref:Uncharacterized protein n=1 Tax=Botrimarina colliarenosi TaxID=2528001 RepID=A0A5C6AHZ8_9BACT|nr:hypothetical protein [Botrimarina colliarenosi]TWT99662.1 hypothetical protein Pla108_06050 [Botrimarina colliarenosi]